MNLNKKIVIFGYPLHSDTQSYIYYGIYKAFRHLGYNNIHWIDSASNFDFSNSFILTERWSSLKLPFEKTATYCVHMLGNRPESYNENQPFGGPERFLGKVKRLIDWRQYAQYKWDDTWYKYDIDKSKYQELSESFYYENSEGYEKIYFPWATDLLPEEINLADRFAQRTNTIYYLGTVGGGRGDLETCLPAPDDSSNKPGLLAFRKACMEIGINLQANDVWTNPLNQEQFRHYTNISYLAPDIRHPRMVDWGYIPCRVFKNISYGHLGVTNSPGVNEFFNNTLVCNTDCYELFYDALKQKNNFDLIANQMEFVRDNHTYINRVKGLINLMEMDDE